MVIKECPVLYYNKYLNILVFLYNNKEIQTTAKLDAEYKTVFIKYKNGRYEVVDKNEYDKYIQGLKKKEISSEKKADTDNSEL